MECSAILEEIKNSTLTVSYTYLLFVNTTYNPNPNTFLDDIHKQMNEMSRHYLRHAAILHNMKYSWNPDDSEIDADSESPVRIKRSLDSHYHLPSYIRDVSVYGIY
jgi:hypothetical protein